MANFKHAWIGYDNHLMTGGHTVTANNEASGYPVSNLRNWFAWQKWKATSGSSVTVTINCGVAKVASYAAICAHSGIQSVYLHGSANGTTWTPIISFGIVGAMYNATYTYNGATTYSSINVTTNNIALRFDEVSYKYYRFTFNGSVAPSVGVLAVGKALDFPRGFYGGFVRPAWNTTVETTNSRSQKGVFLGRSIIRSGTRPFSLALQYVPHAWIDSYWMPFKAHADLYPFVFVWEPDPLDPTTETFNNTDCVLAWISNWQPTKLKDQRFATCGADFDGVVQ